MEIIDRLYQGHHKARDILLRHSEAVAQKALEVAAMATHLKADTHFIHEAALLHDIGMIETDAPMLGCHGTLPYICHGVIGRRMLEAEGLHHHALVSERHIGTGLTVADIKDNKFPLPLRQMLPLSVEEQIICFADKFFSKTGSQKEKSLQEVRQSIEAYGKDKLDVFDSWTTNLNYA